MSAPGADPESKNGSIVLIEKNGLLKKILKVSGSEAKGFSFPYPEYLTKADTAYMRKGDIAEYRRSISLIKSTVDKTGDGIPDVNIIEQAQRLKKKVRACLGYRSFDTAERTLQGVEAVNLIRKGQVKRLDRSDEWVRRSLLRAYLESTA